MIAPGEDDEAEKQDNVRQGVDSLVDEEEAGEIEETVQRWARMNGVDVGTRYSKIPRALTASFSVLEGADERTSFVLWRNPALIGSSKIAAVRLADPAVANVHAVVTFDGTEFRLVDNGDDAEPIVVNGTVAKDVVLHDGDTIRIGSTLLRFDIQS